MLIQKTCPLLHLKLKNQAFGLLPPAYIAEVESAWRLRLQAADSRGSNTHSSSGSS
jgi:hypothetical protein